MRRVVSGDLNEYADACVFFGHEGSAIQARLRKIQALNLGN
jgi:hypothetical protein